MKEKPAKSFLLPITIAEMENLPSDLTNVHQRVPNTVLENEMCGVPVEAGRDEEKLRGPAAGSFSFQFHDCRPHAFSNGT